MAEEKKVNETQEQPKQGGETAVTTANADSAKETFVHSLRVHLVGGQQFTLNEITNSNKAPENVVAFINAWREMRDVWHSPNNDPHFGVRVRDVSMYEYQVARAEPKKEADKPVEAK